MPPRDRSGSCYADICTRKGERVRFSWDPDPNIGPVTVESFDAIGDFESKKNLPRVEARELWAWLLNAGWEPYPTRLT